MEEQKKCYYMRFGLLVTGKGERKSLELLFNKALAYEICHFEVRDKIGQIDPITSKTRIARRDRQNKPVTDKHQEMISQKARRYLQANKCHHLILIDDLEGRDPQHVYDTYRTIIDYSLKPEQKTRVSVHFMVNMLEAYCFADADAVNIALELELKDQISDYSGDVESISHPKGKLKKISSYHEIEDSEKIFKELDLEHVLSDPNSCGFLRSCVAWIVKNFEGHSNQDYIQSLNLEQKYHLHDGIMNPITHNQ